MRRVLAFGGLLAVLLFVACLVGCGGGGSQRLTAPHKVNCLALRPLRVRRLCEGWGTKNVSQPRAAVAPAFPDLALGAERTVDMQDTTDYASTIAGQPFAVAGYLDGLYQSYQRLRASGRWPGNRTVSITVFGHSTAQCGDFEPGDMGAGQAASFFFFERSQGVAKPCLYSSVSEMWSVQGNLEAHGIARSSWRKWCAHYTYSPHLEGDCDALQWSDRGPQGQNVDLNLVKLSFFGPVTPPGPSHQQIVSAVKSKRFYRDKWNQRDRRHQTCGDHPLDGNCPSFREGVVKAQDFLEHKAGYDRVHCWGPLRQQSQAVCVVLRPTLAAWSRAADSSWKQWSRRGCAHRRNIGNCHLFRHRGRYFDRRVRQALSYH